MKGNFIPLLDARNDNNSYMNTILFMIYTTSMWESVKYLV